MIKVNADQYKSLIAANSREMSKIPKYRAKPTTIDGIRFHSKKEAEYYKMLKDKQSKGEIEYFLMQVPFRLPGGIRHYVDFMVIRREFANIPIKLEYEEIEYIECKGRDLPIGKLKRKQTEEIYGIEIKLV